MKNMGGKMIEFFKKNFDEHLFCEATIPGSSLSVSPPAFFQSFPLQPRPKAVPLAARAMGPLEPGDLGNRIQKKNRGSSKQNHRNGLLNGKWYLAIHL